MLSGVKLSESLFVHMYLKGSLTRARRGTSEFKPCAQVAIVPAVIPLKRIFKIVQGVKHFLLSLHFPTVNIDIPPIAVPVVIKRNGEHYSQCSVGVRDEQEGFERSGVLNRANIQNIRSPGFSLLAGKIYVLARPLLLGVFQTVA